MAAINIRRDVSDKYYRYKMPRLISKIEGKGNGIKTVIPNMSDIAKALARPPSYPTKFFGCELGAQVKCDDKNDRYIVNGAHDAEKLASLLDIFIDKFVLCPSCKNPETDFIFAKNDEIIRDCKACGAHLPVDMRHKLVTFILKDKPAKSKKNKKDKKAASGDGAPTPDTNDSDNLDEDEGVLDPALADAIAAEAARLPTAEDVDDDDDWAEDTSAAAVAARMKELAVGGAVEKLMNGEAADPNAGEDDDNEDGDNPLDEFCAFLESNSSASDADIIAQASVLKDHKVCNALLKSLFDANIIAQKQLENREKLIQHFVKNERCQKSLLGGVEQLIAKAPELLPRVALILKALYDLDLVEEEVFLAWGDKSSKKYVDRKVNKEIREKAAPFLNWLREAESESEDEDDD